MDEEIFKQWWYLHLRVASNEALSEEEQKLYETGFNQRGLVEDSARQREAIKQAKAAIATLQAKEVELEAEREKLAAELAELEAARN